MKNSTLKFSSNYVFRYRVGFIRDGVRQLLPWKNNLILDSGLDQIGTILAATCFNSCLFGDQVSPTPVSRNSGAVTFTTVGTACTASGGFFVAQDVGRLIKFDDTDGQERYITNFTSSTLVTLGVAPSPAIVAQTATVWYVNQTALESLYATTQTYGSAGGDNGTTWSGAVRTMKRTFTGNPISGSPVTLTEIGFNSSTSNSNIFDRDIIVGGIGLIPGDIPLAIAELVQTFTPSTPLSVGNSATGYNNSGTVQFCDTINDLSSVNSAGNTQGSGGSIEPPTNSAGGLLATNLVWTFPAFNGTQAPVTGSTPSSLSIDSYTPGSFFRDKNGVYSISTANGPITGFNFLTGAGTFSWGHLLTTPFTKTSSQSLSVTLRYTWQRILQN